jgi:hypothetical protein
MTTSGVHRRLPRVFLALILALMLAVAIGARAPAAYAVSCLHSYWSQVYHMAITGPVTQHADAYLYAEYGDAGACGWVHTSSTIVNDSISCGNLQDTEYLFSNGTVDVNVTHSPSFCGTITYVTINYPANVGSTVTFGLAFGGVGAQLITKKWVVA